MDNILTEEIGTSRGYKNCNWFYTIFPGVAVLIEEPTNKIVMARDISQEKVERWESEEWKKEITE